MKKFALTLLALSCTAAYAESNITVYGVADVGFSRETGGPAGSKSIISSGVGSGSRLGFKGKEDLGGGMAAIFTVESGINMDNGTSGQGGLTFGRQSWVGLTGKFGTLTMGRQYSPYYKVIRDIADPFGDGFAGAAGNIMVGNFRMSNSVSYQAPQAGPFSGEFAYGFGETAGGTKKNRVMSGMVNYANGPVNVALAHNRREDEFGKDFARNTILGASYKVGQFTLHGAQAANRAIGGATSRDTLLGLAFDQGPHRVAVSAILHNDRSSVNQDAKQYAVGYAYAFSPRTDVYTSYGHVNNRNGAAFTIGNATESGSGNAAFNLGLRHVF
ncbi:porin [Massilia sp. NR 4-1]|uniref:porin n=1 Tax=Massilia sp. NR 4-1 TaxID=1678028 RepID=UPI00067BCC40|nr:porin [Massilia sp. NR 4-1]AKU20234.1 porin [Massilia sp. NR 4-1]